MKKVINLINRINPYELDSVYVFIALFTILLPVILYQIGSAILTGLEARHFFIVLISLVVLAGSFFFANEEVSSYEYQIRDKERRRKLDSFCRANKCENEAGFLLAFHANLVSSMPNGLIEPEVFFRLNAIWSAYLLVKSSTYSNTNIARDTHYMNDYRYKPTVAYFTIAETVRELKELYHTKLVEL